MERLPSPPAEDTTAFVGVDLTHKGKLFFSPLLVNRKFRIDFFLMKGSGFPPASWVEDMALRKVGIRIFLGAYTVTFCTRSPPYLVREEDISVVALLPSRT